MTSHPSQNGRHQGNTTSAPKTIREVIIQPLLVEVKIGDATMKFTLKLSSIIRCKTII